MLKNLLKRFRYQLTMSMFNRFYGDLIFGFETADKKLEQLSETQKMRYYESVIAWVESQAYDIEDKGKIQDCYSKLANEAVGEDVQTAYRLALLLIKNHDVRLRMKVQEHKQVIAALRSFNQIKNT